MKIFSRAFRIPAFAFLLSTQLVLVACGPNKADKDSDVSDFSKPQSNAQYPCKTKHPILLVHGVAQRDTTIGMNYFGRIPAYLKDKCKVEVFMGGADAFSISSINADQLAQRISKITGTLGYEKVHIIAHSKGGIDVRFMMFKFKDKLIEGRSMSDRIASITTLGTPHRGSILADFLLSKINEETREILGNMLNIYGVIMGDSFNIDSRAALEMLSSENMNRLNEEFIDLEAGIEGVPSQSWASNVSGIIQDPILKSTSMLMRELGSPINDGAVQEESARYAKYRGIVGEGLLGGVSHMAIVDRAAIFAPGVTPGFDARVFFEKILTEFAQAGL